MPDTGRQRERRADTMSGAASDAAVEAARLADHAGIGRLADELLPALIAKLSTTSLGELEVREGDWQVRLRRPYGVGPGEGRRSTDKASRTQPGHEGHGHGRAGVEGHRPSRAPAAASSNAPGGTGATAGTGAASASNGSGPLRSSARDGGDPSRSIATSPAVGIFQPGPRAASGTRVRAGDSLGNVNVLGVPQEIPAPVDGIVGATLVEAGMPVEYGQELIRLEMTAPAATGDRS